jgi:antitoxin CcdA
MARTVRKQATNVSLRVDLVRRAKALGLNLSALLEEAVVRAIRDAEQKKWLDENEAAIRDANEHFAKHGLFSDDWRKF